MLFRSLGKWSGNTEAELPKTHVTNPDEWRTSLMTVSSPCSASFKLFKAEIRRMYGNKDCRLNTVIKVAEKYQQGTQTQTKQSEATLTGSVLISEMLAGTRPQTRLYCTTMLGQAYGHISGAEFDRLHARSAASLIALTNYWIRLQVPSR